jgi:pyruvate kinase
MNVARFNFSTETMNIRRGMERVREASRLKGLPVARILDTKGTGIRTGAVLDGGTITLAKGSRVVVVAESDAVDAGARRRPSHQQRVTVSTRGLAMT